MKALRVFIAWCLLFVRCWPATLLALFLWPLAWLVSLPFRLIGITLEAVFTLLQSTTAYRSSRPLAEGRNRA